MGVKSTVTLTRVAAERKYLEHLQRQFMGLREMNSSDLEDALEFMDDQEAGGESFNNYMIVEKCDD